MGVTAYVPVGAALFWLAMAIAAWQNGAVIAALGEAAAGFVLLGAGTCIIREQRRVRQFLAWLSAHAESLGEGACYEGQRITNDTVVVSFEACLSFVVYTARFRSRLFIGEQNPLPLTAALYSLATLLFGWWGIPAGPAWSVRALMLNARGGQRETVQEVLSHPDIRRQKK